MLHSLLTFMKETEIVGSVYLSRISLIQKEFLVIYSHRIVKVLFVLERINTDSLVVRDLQYKWWPTFHQHSLSLQLQQMTSGLPPPRSTCWDRRSTGANQSARLICCLRCVMPNPVPKQLGPRGETRDTSSSASTLVPSAQTPSLQTGTPAAVKNWVAGPFTHSLWSLIHGFGTNRNISAMFLACSETLVYLMTSMALMVQSMDTNKNIIFALEVKTSYQ